MGGVWEGHARERRRLRLALTLAGLCAAGPERGWAAQAGREIHLAGGSLEAELIALATQANVSISLSDPLRCAGPGRPLSGRFSVAGALDRLLANSPCAWRQVDANAYEVAPRALRPAPAEKKPAPAPPAPAPPADLAEVVVTATGRPTSADRLAYGVSSLGETMLVGQGVHDLADLSQLTPAMTVTNLGMGRDKILLRGLSDGPLTGRAQSMVGLYLDGVRLTYNAPDPDLRLVDMQRVEVLRGPQGALYGSGSLGGIIDMVTAQPDPSRWSGSISAEGGVSDAAGDSWALDGVVNVPLLDGRAAVRLVVYDEQQGGYIKDRRLALDDVNLASRAGARLAFKLALSPDWALSAGVVTQGISAKDTQYALAGAPPYTRRNDLREPHDNDFTEAHVTLTGRIGGAVGEWSTAYIDHALYSRYDATAAPPTPVPAGPVAFDDRNNIQSLVSEAKLRSADTARVRWLGGLFYARSPQHTADDLTVLGAAPIVALTERRHDEVQEAAAFGEVIVPVGPAVEATLGARLFSIRQSVSSSDSAPLAGVASTFQAGVSRSGVAPKFVLAYRGSAAWLVYVQAAEGYRAGGVNTLGPPGQVFAGPSGPEPFRRYGGDALWNYELGAKLTGLDGRLHVRADIFEAVWRNIQSDLLLPSGLPLTANLGNGANRGAELEAAFHADGLELGGQFVYNGPELNRANPAFPTRSDFGLAVVPQLSGGLNGRWVKPLADGRAFELDGRWAYVGGSRLVLDATTAPKMGDYWTGRLGAAFVTASWRLSAAVDNPLGSRGDTFAYGNPFTVRLTPQITPLRPRTLWLGLRKSF